MSGNKRTGGGLRRMRLAREGWGIVGAAAALAAAAAAVFGWMSGWTWAAWALFLFCLQFFRDPVRDVAGGENAVLAPADGRVVFVGRDLAPEGAGERIKISVFMNVFNVHSNRAPVSGEVVSSRRFPGKFFNAALDKSSAENERHLLEIKTACGEVFCVQIAGLLARRVFCYAAVGDTLSAGARYGFIRFGSRVDVYLPLTSRPTVALGDSVSAGVQTIAELSPGGG